MTTIAYDRKHLAADSRVTSNGDIISDNRNKIIKLNFPFRDEIAKYIVFSGEVQVKEHIIRCIKEDNYHGFDIDSSSALLFTDQSIYKFEGKHFYKIEDEYLSLGSGEAFAMAALRLGKSAKEAVELALKCDSYSGGKVNCVKVR